MRAYHGDEGGGRPYDTRNVEAVVTGDRGPGIGRTDRFDHHRRLQLRPLRELREGCEVCYGPYAASYGAARRGIEGIKAMGWWCARPPGVQWAGGAPGHLVCNGLMAGLCDSPVRFFVGTVPD